MHTQGVCSSGIAAVLLNGKALAAPHKFDSESVTLKFGGMPAASPDAIASIESSFQTASTKVQIVIKFQQQTEASVLNSPQTQQRVLIGTEREAHDCQALSARHGLGASQMSQLQNFTAVTSSDLQMTATLAHSMAVGAISFNQGFEARCQGLNNGTCTPLRTVNASKASLVQMLSTSVSIHTGLISHFQNTLKRSTNPLAKDLITAWGPLSDLLAVRKSYYPNRYARTRDEM